MPLVNAAPKVLVVGWDGAEWNNIKPLLQKGEMPNLQGLIETGKHGNLTSVLPTISPAAWTSMTTGMNPGRHGIFNFLERDTLRPVTSRDVKAKWAWDILSENNYTVAVINVPQTYPPHKVNGVLVGGYLSIEGTDFAYPPSLMKNLEKGGYIIEAMNQEYSPLIKHQLLENLNKTVEKRTQFALELMKQKEFDFFMVAYTGLDRLQHYFWKEMLNPRSRFKDAIPNHYKKLDAILGKLIAAYKPDYVFIVSDHGFMQLKGELYLNNVLAKLGYLKLKHPKGFLARLGLTQQTLRQFTNNHPVFERLRLLAKQFFKSRFAKELPRPSLMNIDLLNSRAYAVGWGGQIYITAKKNSTEYKQIRDRIIDELYKVVDKKTGQKVVKNVHTLNELFTGQETKKAPDLVVECSGYDATGFMGYNSILNTRQIKSGTHKLNGVYIVSGKGLTESQQDRKIWDIAPTILKLYNLSPKMDGDTII